MKVYNKWINIIESINYQYSSRIARRNMLRNFVSVWPMFANLFLKMRKIFEGGH